MPLPPAASAQAAALLPPANSAARLTTVQLDRWKYTENLVTAEGWLHDLAADPGEERDLAWSDDPAHVERKAALRWLLHSGNVAQLEWATALRAHPTKDLLGP